VRSLEFYFSPFAREHYPEYKSWFKDPLLAKALGSIDEDWLAHILNDTTGAELAVTSQQQLIAVIGLSYPQPDHPYYVITNLAIRPDLRRAGLGTQVLESLRQHYPLENEVYWVCYIDMANVAAQHFIEKNNWHKVGPIEDNMIRYELRGDGANPLQYRPN
jgi:ribosomal protein S18 acetylase RimI-like enzyme